MKQYLILPIILVCIGALLIAGCVSSPAGTPAGTPQVTSAGTAGVSSSRAAVDFQNTARREAFLASFDEIAEKRA